MNPFNMIIYSFSKFYFLVNRRHPDDSTALIYSIIGMIGLCITIPFFVVLVVLTTISLDLARSIFSIDRNSPIWIIFILLGGIPVFIIYRFYKKNDRWKKLMQNTKLSPFFTYFPVGLFFLLIIIVPLYALLFYG